MLFSASGIEYWVVTFEVQAWRSSAGMAGCTWRARKVPEWVLWTKQRKVINGEGAWEEREGSTGASLNDPAHQTLRLGFVAFAF